MKNKLLFQTFTILMCFLIITLPASAFIQPIGSAIESSDSNRLSDLTEACFIDEISNELICISVKPSEGKSRESIIPSTLNPAPGESFDAVLDLSIPNYDELTSANILFVQKGSNVVIRNVDILSLIKVQPPMSSMTYTVTLNAPNTAGDYNLRYEIKGRTTQGGSITMLLNNGLDITVGSDACPPATQGAWMNVDTSSSVNGQWQFRTNYVVNPDCSTTATTEYQTVCNRGYYIQGMTQTTTKAPGYKNCLPASVTSALSCGYCQGDSLVKYDGYMARASDMEELNSFNKFLVRLGLKSISREASVGDACSILETNSGDQLLPYSSDVKCEGGIAVVNKDYFQPKITEVYIKSNDQYIKVDFDRTGAIAIPPSLQLPQNGFKEGGIIDVLVGFSNRDAKVYDENAVSPEFKAEVDAAKVSWITNTWWGLRNFDKNVFGVETYVAPRSANVEDFEEGREAIITTGIVFGAIKVIGLIASGVAAGAIAEKTVEGVGSLAGRLTDNSFAAIKPKQSNAIVAHPLYHRAILEVAVYSPEAGKAAYGYTGRAGVPRDLNAQSIQVRRSCQPGEMDRFFVSTVDILLSPPLKDDKTGKIIYRSYSDLSDPEKNAESLVGEAGTVTDGYVEMQVVVPSNPELDVTRPIGRSPVSNYADDGVYYLHAAIFDRCWDGVVGASYLDKKAASFSVDAGEAEEYVTKDCCRQSVLSFLGLGWYRWNFVPKGQCVGPGNMLVDRTSSDWNKCELPADTVPCYVCSSEGGEGTYTILEGVEAVTKKECEALNNQGIDAFLTEAEAANVCGSPEGVRCYTCESRSEGTTTILPNYDSCPNDQVAGGKQYFDEDFFGTDEWVEACGLSLTSCYVCDDESDAGYKKYVTSSGQEFFDLRPGGASETCEALGKNIYGMSGVGACSNVEEFAIVNPNDPSEWCYVIGGESEEDYCKDSSRVFPRKFGLTMSQVPHLDAYVGKNIPFTSGGDWNVDKLIQDAENPICISGIGDLMCMDDSECIQALNIDAPEFRKNKAVYLSIRKNMNVGITKASLGMLNWLPKFVTGTTFTESLLKEYGLCVKKAVSPWDSLKQLVADLFGMEPDNPTVTYVLIGLIILLLLLIFYLTRPKQGKNFNVGGGGYY